jgi:hypothetical protein
MRFQAGWLCAFIAAAASPQSVDSFRCTTTTSSSCQRQSGIRVRGTMGDMLEEVIFSGDLPGYIRKSSPSDAILTEEFSTYLSRQISITKEEEERVLLVEIAMLIANRLQADTNNDKAFVDAIADSASEAVEVDESIDWRDQLKKLQFGESVELTGNEVIDKLGVFEKKKSAVLKQSVKTTDEGANKAQDVVSILRKQEEAIAAALRAEKELDARNNLEWKQF